MTTSVAQHAIATQFANDFSRAALEEMRDHALRAVQVLDRTAVGDSTNLRGAVIAAKPFHDLALATMAILARQSTSDREYRAAIAETHNP